MNKNLSALLTTAVITGLLAVQTAKAEEQKAAGAGDQMQAEKNNCKGMKESNSCKGKTDLKKKKKKDANSCKGSCNQKSEDKKEETK